MSYILILGCSYTVGWQFASLPFNTLNLSHYGGSNDRTVRVCLDQICLEPEPPLLTVISMTFAHRYQYWSEQGAIDIWGTGNTAQDPELNRALDVYTNNRSYTAILDDLANQIILLQSLFRARRLPYVIYNQCNGLDPKQMDWKTQAKFDHIHQDAHTVNFFEFVANRWLYQHDVPYQDPQLEPEYRHYDTGQFQVLEQYLLNYL